MRNSIVLILVIVFSFCNSTKGIAQTTPETAPHTSQIVKKTVAVIKTDSNRKTNDSIYFIKKAKYTTTSDLKDPNYYFSNKRPKLISNQSDSLANNREFNQNVTKTLYSDIHYKWNSLLQKHVSANGNVDYKGFKSDSKKLLEYIHVLDSFKTKIDFDTSSKNEKLAFWINAYNALTVDLIIKNYPIKSIKDIKDPWGQKLWKLGDKWYSLEEIEHEILRKMDEPRIHFAIVCASYSCPKLQNTPFTASNLEQQLTTATKQFLNDTKRNNISENTLKLSKIFRWFNKDFEQNGSLIDFLNQYTSITISEKAKISYMDYNWDLND